MSKKRFFPLSRGDSITLLILIIISLIIFLPWSRRISFCGMVLYGWLMAAFMLIAPIITLISFYMENRESKKGN
jgi:hypothetical protein